MVKASDIIKEQTERENVKYKTFAKIYKNIEKKIILASSLNLTSVWYEIPLILIGSPYYNYKDCVKSIVKQIKADGFKVEQIQNYLIIKWDKKK
jgi:DNA-binding transcriptional regulator YhcF (GntR family)